MRNVLSVLAVAALIAGTASTVFAKTETVKGQLVDQECYQREKKVDDDSACAVQCAKSGKPVALLTADGKVYEVTALWPPTRMPSSPSTCCTPSRSPATSRRRTASWRSPPTR